MRRTMSALCLAVTLIACPLARAQMMGVHFAVPRVSTPDYLKDYFKPDPGLGFDLQFLLGDKTAVEFLISPHRFNVDERRLREAQPPAEGVVWNGVVGYVTLDVVSLSLVRYLVTVDKPVWPYVVAGLGYYRIVPHDAVVSTLGPDEWGQSTVQGESPIDLGAEQNRPALNVGFGMDVRLMEHFAVYAEARYHLFYVKGDRAVITDKKAPGPFDFWTPAAGIRFWL